MRIGVFCPTLNVYGGGEFIAATIANTLAQNNYDVILFVNEYINQREIEKILGKRLNPNIKIIAKSSLVKPKGLLDFYQTIFRSYVFRKKCDLWVDTYSNCIFPWTNISYIHFPFLNHYFYKAKFPYLKSRNILPVGGLPYALLEKNFINYDKKLILANSRYTAQEIRRFHGIKAEVLYPPVTSNMFNNDPEIFDKNKRNNLVVTISRFSPGKELEKIFIQDGDIIFVPSIGEVVCVIGEVKRPAIYELKGDETIVEIIKMAGGRHEFGKFCINYMVKRE